MFDFWSFSLFLAAACVIAISPGPAILYVAARTLAGGRSEGLASIFGTALGGLVHVGAGALGVSALILASAEAFTLLKILGAGYLIYLGIKIWRSAGETISLETTPTGARTAFKEGILVEAFNPKTAAFFLAFIPQFVAPEVGHVALQFIVLGLISVTLNTLVDIVVVYGATAIRGRLLARRNILRRLRKSAASILCGLGASLALARQ